MPEERVEEAESGKRCKLMASSEWAVLIFVLEKTWGHVELRARGCVCWTRPQQGLKGRKEVLWIPLIEVYKGVVVTSFVSADGRRRQAEFVAEKVSKHSNSSPQAFCCLREQAEIEIGGISW